MVAGDLNASCLSKDQCRSNIYKSSELLQFVKRNHLLYAGGEIKNKGPQYTFITKQTMLDYILYNEVVSRKVRYYEILDEGAISSIYSTSDHLPVVVDVMIDSISHRVFESTKKSPAWHKISEEQIFQYQKLLDEPLNS